MDSEEQLFQGVYYRVITMQSSDWLYGDYYSSVETISWYIRQMPNK